MKARSRRYRVVIARTLSTKPLPKIPGRQWQPDRFTNGRDAWGVIARDQAEARTHRRSLPRVGRAAGLDLFGKGQMSRAF
jgi:hypothetical protein